MQAAAGQRKRLDFEYGNEGISPQLPASRLVGAEAEDWWDAVVTGVPELLQGFDANDVAGHRLPAGR